MTDEEIKQSAEKYAESFRQPFDNPPSDYHIGIYDGYIAGAHSRDKEIEQLKESKRKLRLRLLQQIHELRNPWISAEDRLPEDMENVLIVTTYGEYDEFHVACHNPYDFWMTSDCQKVDDGCYMWMPIPELPKKGE